MFCDILGVEVGVESKTRLNKAALVEPDAAPACAER
jgi:hypothetical protein